MTVELVKYFSSGGFQLKTSNFITFKMDSNDTFMTLTKKGEEGRLVTFPMITFHGSMLTHNLITSLHAADAAFLSRLCDRLRKAIKN